MLSKIGYVLRLVRILVGPLHEHLLDRFRWYERYWSWQYHKHIHIMGGVLAGFMALVVVFSQLQGASALSGTWTQSNWGSGVGTSTSTQYSSASGLSAGSSQLSLANSVTSTGNIINDTYRGNPPTQGDGLSSDGSSGIWEGTTNLVANGGDEVNDSDIFALNSSVSHITSASKFGSRAFKTITNGGASGQGIEWTNASGGNISVSASATYTFSVWLEGKNGSEPLQQQIFWFNSSGSLISTSTSSAISASGANFFRYTFSAPAPSNAASAIPAVTDTASPSITFYADGVQLEQKTYATPFVDTEGATASRSTGRMQLPAMSISMDQGWYAARLRMDMNASSNADLYIAQLYIDSTHRLAMHVNGSNWTIDSINGGTTDTASTASSFSGAGTTGGVLENVVFKWTSTTIGVSVNGNPFVTASRSAITSDTLATIDVGSNNGANQLNGDTRWAGAGSGTLTDTDAASLNTAMASGDVAFSTLQTLNSNTAAPTMDWDGSSSTFVPSGTLTSAIFDGTVGDVWGPLTYVNNAPAGTSVSVKVRGNNSANLSGATPFSSCSLVTSGANPADASCLPSGSRYAQYQITLTGSTSATPTFSSMSLSYSSVDTTPPVTNASGLQLFRTNGGDQISSGGWVNGSPYFTWTAGADDAGPNASGLAGYCLYLGQDPSGNPITTKGYLGSSPVTPPGSACQFVVSGTSLDLSQSGILGTALSSSSSPYYLNVLAVDKAGNVYGGSAAQFQFKYDNNVPSNPAYISGPSGYVATKKVTLSWPTTGGSAATDSPAGVKGLQYRIGSSGTWYGANNYSGTQDCTNLIPYSDGSYTTDSDSSPTNPDALALQEGVNVIYFRTWDNACNVTSTYVTTTINLSTSPPSAPQNLCVSVEADPSSNCNATVTNSSNFFSFKWAAPSTFNGSASDLTYCYTVNVTPSGSNCTFTAPGVTSLSGGAYATQPDENTLYVVAQDSAGVINYGNYASINFDANTPAPGVPLNLNIADVSIKTSSLWKLALSWQTPSTVGAGIANYQVYRSTDNVNYTRVASTSGTSYVDSNLNSRLYYYKVQACDSANRCGAFTSVVSLTPTGKFTSPANLLTGPSVHVGTRTATISWTTDRDSSSQVEYGLSAASFFPTAAANTAQAVSHNITLSSLEAGTTYYYQAEWIDVDGNIGKSPVMSFTTLPAPVVSNVKVTNINLHAAIIQLTSTNASAIKLTYGSGGNLSNAQTLNTSTDTSTYNIPLSGLADGTAYTFRLDPVDIENNEYQSIETHGFSTPPAPTISNIQFQPVPGALTGTEQVSWTTNVPATSQISYGQDGSSDNEEAIDTTLATTHTMTISDLNYNTPYQLIATSEDALGNVATSDKQIFHTGLDTRPPRLSNVVLQPSIKGTGVDAQGQIIVSWKTDKPGTSQVAYGSGSGTGYTAKTAEDTNRVANHVVVISGLSLSRVYHLQALSRDEAGNVGRSGDQTTIIGHATQSALSLILSALQGIFGGL